MRSFGRDTMLVAYPGQSHTFVRPRFRRDRLERYLDWYARYLLPARAAAFNPGS
jgi:dipeptidyl aminopeptidase/acylaminoacyl peptidase